MTDVSSKGLIPQLTDVLYALTDSHELLLLKLQAVRREHKGAGRTIIDHPLRMALQTESLQTQSFHAHSYDLADARPLAQLDTKARDTNGPHRASLNEEIGQTVETKELASTDPDANTVVADERASQAQPEARSPLQTPSEVVVPRTDIVAAAPAEPSTPPEVPADVYSDPAGGALADRNYNFFDELDARLTSIKDPDVGSGEQVLS